MKKFLKIYDYIKNNYEFINMDNISFVSAIDEDSAKVICFYFLAETYSAYGVRLNFKPFTFKKNNENEMAGYDAIIEMLGDL